MTTVAGTVTISSLPAISGTVTVGVLPSLQSNTDFVSVGEQIAEGINNFSTIPVAVNWQDAQQGLGGLFVTATCVTSTNRIGTVTVGNSVTISALPVSLSTTTIGGTARLNVTLSSAATPGSTVPSYANLYGGTDGTLLRAISVDTSGRTVVTGSVSLATLPALVDGTARIGSVTASISGTVPISISSVTIGNFPATQPVSIASVTVGNSVTISGTVTVSSLPAISGTVTVSSLPRPTWTNYSGTIDTANTAITVIGTTTRSYLLAQVTTGQIFLNIGATATSKNSVYFSAGQGFAWETSVPQGIVSIISAVTGTNYVLKEG